MASFEIYSSCALFRYKYGRLVVPRGSLPRDNTAMRRTCAQLEKVFAKIRAPLETENPVCLNIARAGTGWKDSYGVPWTYICLRSIRNDEGLEDFHEVLLKGVSGARPDLRIIIEMTLRH